MPPDICSVSATQLARMIRGRAISSAEAVDAHLRRIDAVNPRLTAVVHLGEEAARARARAADDALARGDAPGPLHGVPFTVKDWIETEDLVCAAGFEERRGYVPKRDATVVARMREAGAILLGKTNVNDGSPVYARPNNPYDLARNPGASSGGEAAIIAAGGSPLGIASDSGGSIRWPAHCCGVAALKPTTGLVPLTGHFPRIGPMSDPRTAIGPMARSVDDLALALRIIAGEDGRDAGVVPVPLADMAEVAVEDLRVAYYTRMPGASPTPETVATTEAAARALEAAGARVTEARPPRLEESLPITLDYGACPRPHGSDGAVKDALLRRRRRAPPARVSASAATCSRSWRTTTWSSPVARTGAFHGECRRKLALHAALQPHGQPVAVVCCGPSRACRSAQVIVARRDDAARRGRALSARSAAGGHPHSM
jgi:amidase